MKEFAQRFGKLLEERDLTQKEFAKQSGITESAVSRYVNGFREPFYTTLVRIRTTLGCSWEDLMGK